MAATTEDGVRKIRAGTVFDGTGELIETDPTVIADGDELVYVGPEDGQPDEYGDVPVTHDWSDLYVLPGLVDSHVHTIFGTTGRRYEELATADTARPERSYEQVMLEDSNERMLLRGRENLNIHLQAGVTTMRDAGGRDKVTIHLAAACDDDVVTPAPRLLAAGPPVTQTGGHFFFCNGEADGPEEVRKQVRWLAREGADYIKIMGSGGGTAITERYLPSYTVEELTAIVEEARRHELLTTVHCLATGSIANAVEAGVDCIEHALFIEPGDVRSWDQRIAEELVEKGIYYSPTIQTGYRRREWLLRKRERAGLTEEEEELVEYYDYKVGTQVEQFSRMRELGAKIVMGTDAISHFGDYVLGLELFELGGLPTRECIRVATSQTAEAIGVGDAVGSLEPGKKADVIAVSEDPGESISNLKTVEHVVVRGQDVHVDLDPARFEGPTERDVWPEGRERMTWITE